MDPIRPFAFFNGSPGTFLLSVFILRKIPETFSLNSYLNVANLLTVYTCILVVGNIIEKLDDLSEDYKRCAHIIVQRTWPSNGTDAFVGGHNM